MPGRAVRLGDRGLTRVLCEGGGRLAGALLHSDLVDEIVTSVEEHDVIVRHIETGDLFAAEQAVETNWRNAASRLATVIDTHGERGSW